MNDHIRVRKIDGHWVVRSGGAVLGETRAALELSEGDNREVIYFPREDIAMEFFDRSDKTTHCPHKGDASHFTIVNKSSRTENAAWSYEDPQEHVEQIKGYLAFYARETIKVEQL
jgi:uncharacterized protein (DUF427 family)